MSPSMAMEINSKANVTNYHTPPRHHVRNLWPPVGGGLPGGKPVEPTIAGSSAPMLQTPPDYYNQSISYTHSKQIPRPTETANANNYSYYYKSSQALSDPTVATNVVVAAAAPPTEYSYYYSQQPKFLPPHSEPTVDRWCPPTPQSHLYPSPPLQPFHTHESRFNHQDPTTMFNQVSHV